MILFIDTTRNDIVELRLETERQVHAKKTFAAPRTQAEKLLPEIERLLKRKVTTWREIEKIRIASAGGSFTSLRIGVVTANALAYALGKGIEDETGGRIKSSGIELVEPHYDQAPQITVKKKKLP